MNKNTHGFTIVELLIVIVVIAILAAISIVAYSGISNRANDSSVRSDLTAFAKKVELYRVDSTTNTLPQPPTASLGLKFSKNAYKLGGNNVYYCTSPDGTAFALGAIPKDAQYMLMIASGESISVVPSESISLATVCSKAGRSADGSGGYSGAWMGYTSGGGWASWTN